MKQLRSPGGAATEYCDSVTAPPGPLLCSTSRAIMTKLNKSTEGCRSEPAEMGTVRSGPWKPDLDHANVGRWAFCTRIPGCPIGQPFLFAI